MNIIGRAVCRSGGKYLLDNKEDILKICRKIPDSPCDIEKTGIFDGGDFKAGNYTSTPVCIQRKDW